MVSGAGGLVRLRAQSQQGMEPWGSCTGLEPPTPGPRAQGLLWAGTCAEVTIRMPSRCWTLTANAAH